MFWFKSKKDKEIERLNKKVEELESFINNRPHIVEVRKEVKTLKCVYIIQPGDIHENIKERIEQDISNSVKQNIEYVVVDSWEGQKMIGTLNIVP